MKPRTLKYFFKEALKSMKRNGLMTLASISTVALSLFMLGVFLCGVINLNNMASSLENQVQLSIYLKDGLTTATTFQGVESTHYGQDIVEELFRITQVIRIGGIVLIAFLAAATLFIISNTIRLTVFARRKEIAIMKYVGATNGFIRWPFLIEGMLLGLVGAIIAVLCVGEFYHFITMEVSESLAFFPLVPMFPFFYDVAIYILVGGIIVGAIGSTISLKQYMKV